MNTRDISYSLAALCLLLLMSLVNSRAEAKTLTFPGTPVSQMTVDTDDWSDRVDQADTFDSGKGCRYTSTSEGTLGVAVLDTTVPATVKTILTAAPGHMSGEQVKQLSDRQNPWIIRYCAERGKPRLITIAGRKYLINDFTQEERICVEAKGGGSRCLIGFKIEAHAFTLAGSKLVHISLITSTLGNSPESSAKVDSSATSATIQAILASSQWQ